MKKLIIPLFFLSLIAVAPSCKEVPDNRGKTLVVEDSLKTIFPTWQAVQIKVSDDQEEMSVIIGDLSFYKASSEVKNKKAVDLGQMVLRIYGKGNSLTKGKLIVTKDINNKLDNPPDGIILPINFDEMNKAMYPK